MRNWTVMAEIAPLLIGLLAYVATFLIWSWLLVIGARWAKLPSVDLSKAMFVAMFVKTSVVALQAYTFIHWLDEPSMAWSLLLLFAPSIIEYSSIKWFLNGSKLQTLKAWLPTWLAVIPSVLGAIVLFRPFVMEGFSVPTCAMAPTVLGEHILAACPECGSKAYASAWQLKTTLDSSVAYDGEYEQYFVCDNRHLFEQPIPRPFTFHQGDRVLVNKLVKPKRWDIIAFRAPTDPSKTYIKRLVALPGETVQIKDGSVWVNGEKLTPPDSLSGITYAAAIQGQPIVNGIDPITLGSQEHFVLGDFTMLSFDSRLWPHRNPPDRFPAYAVPASDIYGVATHLYLSRWKSIRP